jgi:hypothetical protein
MNNIKNKEKYEIMHYLLTKWKQCPSSWRTDEEDKFIQQVKATIEEINEKN